MSAPGPRFFDTHAHIMSADLAAYPPSEAGRTSNVPAYEIGQLRDDMEANGVTHACVVQRFHYYFTDNSYALNSSLKDKQRLTPVIMLWGEDETAPAKLKELAKRQPIGGIRFATTSHARYDTAWMNGPSTMRLWETAATLGLPVVIIFYLRHVPWNLPALALLAEKFPETQIVIDHMGLPHAPVAYLEMLREGQTMPFVGPPGYAITEALREMRAYRNVWYKLTGINLEYLEHHKVEAAPFVRRFVNEFGADRIMCGTDIGQTKGPYSRLVSELRQSLALLDDSERDAILYGNANKVFGRGLSA